MGILQKGVYRYPTLSFFLMQFGVDFFFFLSHEIRPAVRAPTCTQTCPVFFWLDKTTSWLVFKKEKTIYGLLWHIQPLFFVSRWRKEIVVWLQHSSGQLVRLEDSSPLQSGKLISDWLQPQCQGEGLLTFWIISCVLEGGLELMFCSSEDLGSINIIIVMIIIIIIVESLSCLSFGSSVSS